MGEGEDIGAVKRIGRGCLKPGINVGGVEGVVAQREESELIVGVEFGEANSTVRGGLGDDSEEEQGEKLDQELLVRILRRW